MTDDLRLLAFYLPQYHPIPENDEWWGRGFTEWTNVTKARPLFRGHHQPHLPADLGFYDLRLPETREAQAALARQHGIDGFCWYHYWFNGRRLLERPFQEVLESGRPDFPFCLCWANENWTRIWDGGADHRLLSQVYGPEDDVAHMRWLCRAFDDSRYIRVEGRPVFLVYRASELPDASATTRRWREVARAEGFPDLYLCRVEASHLDRGDPRALGFDAGVEFQPDVLRKGPRLYRGLVERGLRKYLRPNSPVRLNNVFRYPAVVEESLRRELPPYPLYRCVTPSWDNSARKTYGATIFVDSSPEEYERWLRAILARFRPYGPERNLVFVNAWNEWAEGNHLEPDRRWGRAYLEATLRAVSSSRAMSASHSGSA